MLTMDQAFWDQQHSQSDLTWLSGNPAAAYFGFFNLSPEFLRGKDVLEIGVGMGQATRQLVPMCRTYHCADISQVALDRVSDCVASRYLTRDIASIPAVDVVFCYLVTVHCPDEEVTRIINDIQLTDGGAIFMQFSAPQDDGQIDQRAKETFVDNGSHHFRTRAQIESLIGHTNKKIKKILPTHRVNHDNWFTHDWHAVVLEKALRKLS